MFSSSVSFGEQALQIKGRFFVKIVALHVPITKFGVDYAYMHNCIL